MRWALISRAVRATGFAIARRFGKPFGSAAGDHLQRRLGRRPSHRAGTGEAARTLPLPLRQPESHTAAGQGSASPGDVLRVPQNHASGQDKGQGITEPGGVQFVLELAIDDIVDWLWEELEAKSAARVGG